MTRSSADLSSAPAESTTAATVTTMYVRLPVRSKNRSVCRRYAGTNATHWITNANATHRANTGKPPTVLPPWLPATATPAATATATGRATSAARSALVTARRSEECGPTLLPSSPPSSAFRR